MTDEDFQFMKEMGIEPSSLDDPLPGLLPPPTPPGAWYIPFVTEEDESWLLKLRVLWEPEPGFVPPKTFGEYLARYPDGIREAVEWSAKCLELALSSDDLDGLAQEISLGFALDGKDIVEGYPLAPYPTPGACKSVWFHRYIRGHVYSAVKAW